MRYLALAFTVLPLVDLWLLLSIGEVFGFWPTIGLTIVVAFLGAYLGKREGLKVLAQWKRALGEFRMPEDGLVSAALVLVGAVLLITPGVLSDALGLLLLFPPSRRVFAKVVGAYLTRRFARAAEEGRFHVHVQSVDFTSADDIRTRFTPEDIVDQDRQGVVDTVGEDVPLLPQNASRNPSLN